MVCVCWFCECVVVGVAVCSYVCNVFVCCVGIVSLLVVSVCLFCLVLCLFFFVCVAGRVFECSVACALVLC